MSPICYICHTARPVQKLFNKCEHESACYECLRRHYIETPKNVNDYPLVCFHPDCHRQLQSQQIERLSETKEEINQIHQLFSKRHKKRLQQWKDWMGPISFLEIARCPWCGIFIFKDGGCDHMCCTCGRDFFWDKARHSFLTVIRKMKGEYSKPPMNRRPKKLPPVQLDHPTDKKRIFHRFNDVHFEDMRSLDPHDDEDVLNYRLGICPGDHDSGEAYENCGFDGSDYPHGEESSLDDSEEAPSKSSICSLLAAGVTLEDLKESEYPQYILDVFEEVIKDVVHTSALKMSCPVNDVVSTTNQAESASHCTNYASDASSDFEILSFHSNQEFIHVDSQSDSSSWEEVSEAPSVMSFNSNMNTGMSFLEAVKSKPPVSVNPKKAQTLHQTKAMKQLESIHEEDAFHRDVELEEENFQADPFQDPFFLYDGMKNARGGKQVYRFKNQPKTDTFKETIRKVERREYRREHRKLAKYFKTYKF